MYRVAAISLCELCRFRQGLRQSALRQPLVDTTRVWNPSHLVEIIRGFYRNFARRVVMLTSYLQLRLVSGRGCGTEHHLTEAQSRWRTKISRTRTSSLISAAASSAEIGEQTWPSRAVSIRSKTLLTWWSGVALLHLQHSHQAESLPQLCPHDPPVRFGMLLIDREGFNEAIHISHQELPPDSSHLLAQNHLKHLLERCITETMATMEVDRPRHPPRNFHHQD